MSIELKEYSLPDFEVFWNQNTEDNYCIWQPDNTYLILGQSNNIEKSLFIDKVIEDNITVMKRPSGGETVILTPNTLVVSAIYTDIELKNPRYYFTIFNDKIIKALNKVGITNVTHKGISDLAIEDKKILGSSIYRKKDKVFYHSVLNVSERIEVIEKYIRHPQREPDYRKGREHSEFVTSLIMHYPKLKMDNIINSLADVFKNS